MQPTRHWLQQLTANVGKFSAGKQVRKQTSGGRWGEITLRRIVEMANVLDYCDYGDPTWS